MTNTEAVGIDLGTTNSAAARIDESGRSAMVANAEGDLLTPSVVLFDDDEVIVGKEARSATTVHPDQVAERVKRDMGSPVFSQPIRGEFLPPEVIQACILRKLKADLATVLGPRTSTVITVPAYFDESRRKATADSGEMAGLSVLDIVNEPTAAALAFGETLGYLAPSGGPTEEMTVVVYDLGGGTFDATLIRLAPGDIRTLATDGDVQLGGHDWDLRLVNHAAQTFKQSHGVDPREDPAALNRLYGQVIEAKHTLSARGKAIVRIDHGGASEQIAITREEFEDLTADLVERTAYTTRQLLADAHLEWSDVDRVLLVGGSTRMPMISRMIQEMTGIAPDRTVNPDEAVARGAAIYARYVLAKRAESTAEQPDAAGPGYEVTNVNAHSLGIEGVDQRTERKTNAVLIARNTPLPARHTEKFVTKTENQRSIVVQVLEGESSVPDECSAIARTVIRDLPEGLPQGSRIEVTFEYAENGLLNVRAVVPGTTSKAVLEIERASGMTGEKVERWKKAVSTEGGFDLFEEMLDDILMAGPAAGQLKPIPLPTSDLDESGGDSDYEAPATERLSEESPEPYQATPMGPQRISMPSQSLPLETAPVEPAPLASIPLEGTATWKSEALAEPEEETESVAEAYLQGKSKWHTLYVVLNVVGLVGGAILGLFVGYLVITWLVPDHGLPRLW